MEAETTATNRAGVVEGDMLAGKYRVEHVLGEGGMGVVIAATHEALHQRVAIKILDTAATSKVDPRRFEREARTGALLKSVHSVRTFDVGKLDDGRSYIVMEYLEGESLGDIIAKGPELEVATAVGYVLQACVALAEAHKLGIVHRDLKPDNLFLTTLDGVAVVKVLDFGIAKVEAIATDSKITTTKEIFGSPAYMSPEQLVSARDVDRRADIWALGVILYELLTKTLPFDGRTVAELVMVIGRDRETPARDRRSDVPRALSDLIGRCLLKDKEGRFANIVDLVAALAPFGSAPAADVERRVQAIAYGSSPALPPSATSSSRDVGADIVNNANVVAPVKGTQVIEAPPVPISVPVSPGFVATFDEFAPTLNERTRRPRKSRSTPIVIVAAIGVVAIAGSTYAYVARRHNVGDPDPTPVTIATTTTATTTTAREVPTPAVSVSTPPSGSASASASAPSPSPSSIRTAAHPTAPRSAKPAASPTATSLYGRE